MKNGLNKIPLYSGNTDYGRSVQAITNTTNPQRLWHQRFFGHQDKTAIKQMETLKSVSGIYTKKNNYTDICQDCKSGKMTRVPLNSRVLKPHATGQVIFSGVCGPFSTESLGAAKFFTFIDGYCCGNFSAKNTEQPVLTRMYSSPSFILHKSAALFAISSGTALK